MAKLTELFVARRLTRKRIGFAFAVAAVTDLIQLGLGPFGWVFVDQVLDVIAAVLVCAALGFHPLLLPTFVVEFLPITDMLPTWIGCTAAVVLLRKRSEPSPTPPPIDVAAEVTRVPPEGPR